MTEMDDEENEESDESEKIRKVMPRVDNDEIKVLLEKILTKLDVLAELKDEVKQMTKSLNHLSDEMEDVKKENVSLNKRIDELEAKLEQKNETEKHYNVLQKNMEEMRLKQHESEQYERNKNIEINGLDEVKNENVNDIMQKLATAFKVDDFKLNMVDKMHRIPSKNKDKPNTLIVQFKHRMDRDKWLESKKKTVTNDQILQNANGKRIYVNENMTPYYRQLFWKTKNYAKENNIKYVWFKNGKVLTRVDEKEKKVTVIRSEMDLK